MLKVGIISLVRDFPQCYKKQNKTTRPGKPEWPVIRNIMRVGHNP